MKVQNFHFSFIVLFPNTNGNELEGQRKQRGKDKQKQKTMSDQDSTSFASILAGVQKLRESGEVSQPRPQTQQTQPPMPPMQRPMAPRAPQAQRVTTGQRSQTEPQTGQKRVNAFNQDRPRTQSPLVRKPSSLSVNSRQKQNPLMNFLTNVNYIFVEQRNVYDFLVSGRDVIFLSLKYHKLHPEYIQNRMKALLKKNAILITVVDVENNETILREINKMCLYSDFTFLVAFTYEQAAKYLTYLATATAPIRSHSKDN